MIPFRLEINSSDEVEIWSVDSRPINLAVFNGFDCCAVGFDIQQAEQVIAALSKAVELAKESKQ